MKEDKKWSAHVHFVGKDSCKGEIEMAEKRRRHMAEGILKVKKKKP